MKNLLKQIWAEFRSMVKTVTPAQAIAWELAEAEMALLRAETGVDFAQSEVAYNKNRIKRLKAYMAASTAVDEPIKEAA
jgi:hypothetical protein